MPQNFHLALERISGFNKIEYTSKTYESRGKVEISIAHQILGVL